MKKLTLTSAPEILVLHLNRFIANKADRESRKSHKTVHFRDKISISYKPLPGEENEFRQKYSLKGIVVHHGEELSEGHFTASVEDCKTTKEWVMISDRVAHQVDMQEVYKQEAYILFYEKTSNAEVSTKLQAWNLNTIHAQNCMETKMSEIFAQWKKKVSWRSVAEKCNIKLCQKLKGGTSEDHISSTVSEDPSVTNSKIREINGKPIDCHPNKDDTTSKKIEEKHVSNIKVNTTKLKRTYSNTKADLADDDLILNKKTAQIAKKPRKTTTNLENITLMSQRMEEDVVDDCPKKKTNAL